MIIGVGNLGSTSLKSKIFEIDAQDGIVALGEANLDCIKSPRESTFTTRIGNGPARKDSIDIVGFSAGIAHLLDWYVENGVVKALQQIEAIGFKTVMGVTNGANNLTPAILGEMEMYGFVAPIHNLPYVEAIAEFKKRLNVPMVGVFEPSFHYTLPEYRRYLGLPWEWNGLGIKRLGFHGASHRYLSAMAARAMGTSQFRLITAHLGGSSSLCAIEDGRSVDISTSFSPNSGVLQGNRCGDIDGTALLFAMKKLGLSPDEAQRAISNEGGLRGMAGLGTEDLRSILDAAETGNGRARMTVDLFCDGVRKHIAALAASMGGVDCIVVSGGIGENSAEIRSRCLERMEFMGVKLDARRNSVCRGEETLISTDDSPVTAMVIPTNEEMVVAYFTKKVVEYGRDLTPEEMVFCT
jgi:acetate kinase